MGKLIDILAGIRERETAAVAAAREMTAELGESLRVADEALILDLTHLADTRAARVDAAHQILGAIERGDYAPSPRSTAEIEKQLDETIGALMHGVRPNG